MADASNLNVLVICGSLRKGSYNAMVANTLPDLVPDGMKLTRSPTIVMPLYNADVQTGEGFPAPATALADAIRGCDGVIIVTPEYNYSIPGVLKNAIDWLSRMQNQPFANKPVAIQSATQGPLGGPRMQYHLRQSLISLSSSSPPPACAARTPARSRPALRSSSISPSAPPSCLTPRAAPSPSTRSARKKPRLPQPSTPTSAGVSRSVCSLPTTTRSTKRSASGFCASSVTAPTD